MDPFFQKQQADLKAAVKLVSFTSVPLKSSLFAAC